MTGIWLQELDSVLQSGVERDATRWEWMGWMMKGERATESTVRV